jgi:hypothetical protein
MVKTNLNIWEKLSNFSLDNPEASFSFTERLARENGWAIDFSKRVVEEYKKFIYMSVVSGRSLTPSDEVDQAWHLHLVYSYSYWVEMCEKTLGGFRLHHGPTKGGKVEKKRYDNQYSETLKFYEEEFGYEPPKDIWPNHEIRFGKINFRRVNMHDNIVINKEAVKKHSLSLAMIAFAIICSFLFISAKPKDDEVSIFIIFCWVIGILGVIFLIRGIYRYSTRNSRRNGSAGAASGYSSSSSSADSGCSIISSFFGCGGDSGCGSSGCGSSGCGGCGGCGS